MISPLTIYLILMLDNIKVASGITLLVVSVAAVICFIVTMVNSGRDYASETRCHEAGKRGLKITVPLALLCVLVQALVPNSKQAAAIFLIPAIANNENVQREASELYDLAKQGLKNLATPDKKEPQQ